MLLLAATSTAVAEPLHYSPAQIHLGKLQQGEQRQVTVQVVNPSKKEVQIIDCIAQGRGPKKILYPKKLGPGGRGELSFLFDSSELEGQIAEHLTLIQSDEELSPLPITALVEAPVALWPGIVDFEWLGTTPQSVVLYAYSPVAEQFDLKFDSAQLNGLFSATITPTLLDVARYPEELSEATKKGRPGYKIVLTIDPLKWPAERKSLGALGRFYSPQFPAATPEFYAVGYRK